MKMRITDTDWLPAELERAWIAVHAVWAVASVLVTLVVYGLSRAVSLDAAQVPWALILIFGGISIIFYAGLYWLYAMMSAKVLRRVLPVFPDENWTTIHMTIGAVVGLVTAFAYRFPGQDDDLPLSGTELVGMFFVMIAFGAALGAAVGGLQALVLRKFAGGLRTWIVCLSMAIAVCLPIVVLVSQVYGPKEGWPNEIVAEILGVMATVACAAMMIPALRRLRPA
jgi:hypothetical protein